MSDDNFHQGKALVSNDSFSTDLASGPSPQEMIFGLGLFSLSIAFYSVYCMLIKIMMVEYGLSVPELTYYISIWLVVMFYLMARYQKVDIFAVPKTAQKDLFIRCITGVLSDILLFVAFDFTSFSRAFCLFFTNTLMAPFTAKAILGEPIKKWDIIGILFGFTGMLMIIQPFSSSDPDDVSSSEDVESQRMRDMIGSGISLLAAFNAALAIIYIRKLSGQVDCTIQPMYYMLSMSIFCPIWSLVIPVTKVANLTDYRDSLYLAIFGLALVLFGQQAMISKSMEYNTVGIVQVILFLAIPFGYFLDWAVLNQPMGAMELGGAAVICSCNILIATLRVKGIID